jgi:hypothetical protein
MTLTVQTEEKPAISTEMAPNTVDNAPEEALEREDGWRIAREALLREVMRYGGQSALVLALIGAIGYAGYWSLGEMRSLPAFLQKVAWPFMPPPVAAPNGRNSAGIKPKLTEEKSAARVPVKKHHHRLKNDQIAKVGRRPNYPVTSDDPTGGRIIYSDGMITQYSWNK